MTIHDLHSLGDNLDKDSMRRIIAGLKPDKEVFAGRIFFDLLLEARGVEGVLNFIEKASRAEDENSSIDYYFDFDAVEKRLFDRSYLNLMDRRSFLGTAGCVISGGAFAITGAAGVAAQAHDLVTGQPIIKEHSDDDTNPFRQAENVLVDTLAPPAELLIGAVLIDEGVEKWAKLKMEHISDSMDLIADEIKAKATAERAGRG